MAIARPRCLYCGGELPPALLAAVEAAARAAAAQPGPAAAGPLEAASVPAGVPERSLLVLDLADVESSRLAEALGIDAFEAAQMARRGGLALFRALEPEAALEETARLASCGIRSFAVPEAEARASATPFVLLGGQLLADRLIGRATGTNLELVPPDLLVVVRGPIHRELLPVSERRSPRTTRLSEGYRFHLHRRSEPRPLELDPAGFEFDDRQGELTSSLLRVSSWLQAFAREAPSDDGFRWLAPALGAAETESEGRLAFAGALASAKRQKNESQVPQLLDNLRQFRFYSAWRGAVERRRVAADR